MGSTDGGRGNESGSTASIKWIVIGVVAMTFLFMFRGQLSRLLDRATGVKISTSGIEIVTVETLLGKTEVSNVSLPQSRITAVGIQGSTYTSQQYRFQISWPDNGTWTASESYGQTLKQQLGLPPTMDIPVVVLNTRVIGNFRPNVNVLVDSVGNMSITEYMNQTVQHFERLGWEIQSFKIDEATDGGLLVFFNTDQGDRLYQVQRLAVAYGRVYIVTASQLPPDDMLSRRIREELRRILNSFRLIQS